MTVPEVVAACSPWDGDRFDPRSHVAAVNRLRQFTVEDVLHGLRTYLREIPRGADAFLDGSRVQLLTRVLFVPRRGGWQAPLVGRPVDGPPPSDDLPLYPIQLVADVPLLVVRTVVLAGHPENPAASIDFAEDACVLRSEPLRPPENPLDLDDDRAMIRAQLLRLVRPAYVVDRRPGADPRLGETGVWQQHRNAFARLGIRWDPGAQAYTRPAD